jgi:hypothetical protein
MASQIPFVPSIPLYRFGTSIGGVQYIIDVHWNGREEKWYMDLLTDDEVVIRYGIPLVLGAFLGHGDSDPNWPDGFFYAIDLSNAGVDAGFADLGSRVVVYHLTAAELESFGG